MVKCKIRQCGNCGVGGLWFLHKPLSSRLLLRLAAAFSMRSLLLSRPQQLWRLAVWARVLALSNALLAWPPFLCG